MGVGVSHWGLARTVSMLGQLGVVSGTGLAAVLARRLQAGDEGGHLRRAMARFPCTEIAQRVLKRYFVEGGKPPKQPYKYTPMPRLLRHAQVDELTLLANFVEVYLAKEGHSGPIGINYLEKIQLPTLASLYGAMLAGVDYVLMGAGIPRSIPGILDAFAAGRAAEQRIEVLGASPENPFVMHFDPAWFLSSPPILRRPQFIPIVSSAVLALNLARKSNGQVNGFVVEGPTAGGHNAPPRGPLQLSDRGEPIYGERDVVEMGRMRDLGLPFWLAGGYAHRHGLARALEQGAAGIQVGTAFAFCNESGITPELKKKVLQESLAGRTDVFTDPSGSPTGFPFKVLRLAGTVADPNTYCRRKRVCDLGFLRQMYRREDGRVGYRCPAEPMVDYVRKQGLASEAHGRLCLCNGLFSTIGHGQRKANGECEPPLLTAGDDVKNLRQFLPEGASSYSAADVLRVLLNAEKASLATSQ